MFSPLLSEFIKGFGQINHQGCGVFLAVETSNDIQAELELLNMSFHFRALEHVFNLVLLSKFLQPSHRERQTQGRSTANAEYRTEPLRLEVH